MESLLIPLADAPNHFRIRKSSATGQGEIFHRHDYYQIFYVNQGAVIHRGPNRKVRLQPGDAYIVPPGYVHSTQAEKQEEVCYYSLSFTAQLFSPGFAASPAYSFLSALRLDAILTPERDVRMQVQLPHKEQENIRTLLDCLLGEYTSPWDQADTMASHLVAAILRILSRAYVRHSQQDPDPIARAVRYIDANSMLELTVEGLARQFALSRSAFAARFRERTGLPVKQYIHQKRMEQAGKLCASGSIPTREVARMVGYTDFSTFYRQFQKHFGCAPSRYGK